MIAGSAPTSDPTPSPAPVCAVLPNPTAGRGRHDGVIADALAALSEAGLDVRVLEADTVEDALAVSRRAVEDGAAALVAMGGDGTVHLAVQAVAHSSTALGVIPVGTGNDFATESAIPSDPVAAAVLLADALKSGRSRRLDLARIDGPGGFTRRYAAVLGAGFDALVNERANGMTWPKGRRRYDFAIFAELVGLRPRHYTITLDGQATGLDAVLVAVGNTASYGGGMRMCPAADPTDGLLDVVIAGPLSRTTLLRLQTKVYSGNHVSHPQVTALRARTVGIDAEGITVYADGERMCPLPVTITAEPGAVTLLA